MAIRLGILTVSDAGSRGEREDRSGDAIAAWAAERGHEVTARALVPDDTHRIVPVLLAWCDGGEVDLLLTTGGTGLGPRDVTPEATRAVLEREAPGLAEEIRRRGNAKTVHAMLSRGLAGARGATLVVNLPGSPERGARRAGDTGPGRGACGGAAARRRRPPRAFGGLVVKDDVVLISTHDLERAGALREAFTRAGYGTDLVTATEEVQTTGAVLLVLTGGAERGGGELARQARERLRIPVFAIVAGEHLPPALRPGFDEVFAASTTAADVAAVGRMAIERRRLQRITGIIGETDAMREVLERVVQIAPVSATVLVTGESGTGKELVARGIHGLSPRRHKPFIAVNVAALSETLLESELFGHEKGAFTGAIDSRRGLFELAHGGTIFLDEIGEMPMATQTKLLRVLEQREFHRVGGEKAILVDVRIVAATNQDLRQLLAIGEFRRDLYFRLNVLHIVLPPLRERREDIPLLVEEFVRDASERHDRQLRGPLVRGDGDPARLRMARQRPRAAQPRRVDGRARARPHDRAERHPLGGAERPGPEPPSGDDPSFRDDRPGAGPRSATGARVRLQDARRPARRHGRPAA